MDTTTHWEEVYTQKDIQKVSWYQSGEMLSAQLIVKYSSPDSHIFDSGSGASTLVDTLLQLHYKHITLLDISSAALEIVKQRIGNKAQYIHNSVLNFNGKNIDIWHDRAVLHFLTRESQYKKYFQIMDSSVAVGGTAIIATFAPDKERKCSGLNTKAYDVNTIQHLAGKHWKLLESLEENHATPGGDTQLFNYFCLQKTSIK